MKSASIPWYSLGSDLKPREHAPVDFKQALEIVDQYYLRAGGVYDHGEDALAASLFGFSRSPSEFIEFSVNAPADISYKFEWADPSAPWLRRLFGGTFQFEEALRTKAEVVRRVEEFFTMDSAAIKEKIKRAAR